MGARCERMLCQSCVHTLTLTHARLNTPAQPSFYCCCDDRLLLMKACANSRMTL